MRMWQAATSNKIFMFIAGLSFKPALALATSVSGALGVILGEIFTNQWGNAGLAGVVAAGIGAFFVFIPRFMEQRRKNVETFSEVKEKEMGHIVSRLADLAEKEKAFLNLQLTEAQYIASLERKSKHDLAGALGAAQDHNLILAEQLKKAGLEPVITLHPVNASQISSRVDEEIKTMRLKSIDAAHRAVNASTDGTTAIYDGKR